MLACELLRGVVVGFLPQYPYRTTAGVQGVLQGVGVEWGTEFKSRRERRGGRKEPSGGTE